MNPTQFGILAFSSLFAMVDPIAAAPMFVQLTRHHQEKRKRIAFRASMTALIALGLFATSGGAILGFFGVTVPAFQIAGGLLFLLSALRVLHGGAHEGAGATEGDDPSVVPIGIPLIAGAGSMSTVMVLSGQAQTDYHRLALGGAILLTVILTFATLLIAPKIAKALGNSGQEVMSKIMALLSAVIGVQFIINGLTAVVSKVLLRH